MGIPRSMCWVVFVFLGPFALSVVAQEAGVPSTVAAPAATNVSAANAPIANAKANPAEPAEPAEPANGTATARGPAKSTQDFWVEFFTNPVSYLLLAMLVMYLLIFLPAQRANRKSQREQQEQLANLKKNDRVVTSFGVHGVISNIQTESGTVTIRVDESTNAKLTVNRETIRVVKKD
jgi:preprotein translocase subunit YajC